MKMNGLFERKYDLFTSKELKPSVWRKRQLLIQAPLACLLEDEDLLARAKKYVDAIIDFQCDDGRICPCSQEDRAGDDMWALLLLGKVLVLWHDCTGGERRKTIPSVPPRTRRIVSLSGQRWRRSWSPTPAPCSV